MFPRHAEDAIRASLADTPVVLLSGARQTGKSTLAQKLARDLSGQYVTLDDLTTLAAAAADPVGFVAGLDTFSVIDEVQKAPQLFPAIKVAVDRDRRPGRFMLTGSANVLLLPKLSESLAGRMEVRTLWPLSQGELRGVREDFLTQLFNSAPTWTGRKAAPDVEIEQMLVAGGFPEPVGRSQPQRRQAWFSSYVTTVLPRDVRDLARIEGLTDMPRLLMLLAARPGALLSYAELSRASGMPQSTLKRYLALLEATYLLQPLPAWSTNLGKRLIKSPKIHLVDLGLCTHLIGADMARLRSDTTLLGHLVEAFVVGELRKQADWAQERYSLFHFRTTAGQEVDAVVEDGHGRVAAVEVKAASSVTARDFAGIECLREQAGKRFACGVVLYRGEATLPFGKRLWAVPITSLWNPR